MERRDEGNDEESHLANGSKARKCLFSQVSDSVRRLMFERIARGLFVQLDRKRETAKLITATVQALVIKAHKSRLSAVTPHIYLRTEDLTLRDGQALTWVDVTFKSFMTTQMEKISTGIW